MALFQPGQPKQGGRAKGVRNRLSHSFLEALHKDFEEHGEEVIRICRVERPTEYVKIVADLMPKELEIPTTHSKDIDDDELTGFMEYVALQLEPRTARLASRADEATEENRLNYYRPYQKQKRFHEAGAKHSERLLMAGNQLGKLLRVVSRSQFTPRADTRNGGRAGASTGRPWVGVWRHRQSVRNTVQKVLVGRTGQEGTGAIPKDAIAELVSARGTPDLLDTIRVNHVSGGVSIIGLKTYASGREKFQGETLDYVWLDEEPPADIYTEAPTSTNVGASPVWLTFTPLQGVSTVVKRFLHEQSHDRYKMVMTIDDVEHYPKMKKKRSLRATPRMRRRRGLRGYLYLAPAAYSPFPRGAFPLSTANSSALAAHRRYGFRLGPSVLQLWNWCGTAIRTLFTLAAHIG